jgi:hypothetical protein
MLAAVWLFAGQNTAYAADYTITITDANLTHNQSLVFDAPNIGPGFNTNYNVRVDNQSTGSVMIGVHDIEEDAANSLSLNELRLALSYHDSELLQLGPGSDKRRNFVCVGSGANDLFTLNVSMGENLGNEYQDKSFQVYITFHGDAAECRGTPSSEITVPEEDVDTTVPPLPLLPNTGESRGVYHFLYGTIIFFFLLTAIFLIIFIVRRRDNDQEKPAKPPAKERKRHEKSRH